MKGQRMDEEKIITSYEAFRDAVEAYEDVKEYDMLTDPGLVAGTAETRRDEEAISHGHRLRAARELRGFTFQELSERTGIEAELLAQVEAGESYLPLGNLIRVSKALSLKMSDVISTGDEPFTIVRCGEGRSFARFGKAKQASHGYEYESLAANKKDRVMEPFIVTLHPAAGERPSSHDGQEFIYVLDGEMELVIGDIREVLGPGDSVYYDSSSEHLIKAYGDRPAKILAVLVC